MLITTASVDFVYISRLDSHTKEKRIEFICTH